MPKKQIGHLCTIGGSIIYKQQLISPAIRLLSLHYIIIDFLFSLNWQYRENSLFLRKISIFGSKWSEIELYRWNSKINNMYR